MASIRTRQESENLMIDFRYQGIRYRHQTPLSDTAKNRHILLKDLRKIEAEIELGVLDVHKVLPNTSPNKIRSTGRPTLFRNFSMTWLDEKKAEWKSSYCIQAKAIIDKHLVPNFGIKDIKEITKADILNFRKAIVSLPGRNGNESISVSRVNHILSVLRQIVEEASERLEFKSPFINIKALRLRKPEIHPFNLTEIQKILKKINPKYKNYFTTRFFTGLRSSEIHGLKWKNIDFENRRILIRECWINGEATETKNDGSTRDVDISSIVINALKDQLSITGDQEYVFSNRKGNPLDTCNITKRVWYPTLDELGLDRRRPYQTRHTCASLWLSSGESPEWISKQLGHSNTSMLFKVYSRFVPNHARQDGMIFDDVINKRFNKNSS